MPVVEFECPILLFSLFQKDLFLRLLQDKVYGMHYFDICGHLFLIFIKIVAIGVVMFDLLLYICVDCILRSSMA